MCTDSAWCSVAIGPTRADVYTCLYTCLHTCLHTCLWMPHMHVDKHVCLQVYTHAGANGYTHAHTRYTYPCTYPCIWPYTVHISMHMHIQDWGEDVNTCCSKQYLPSAGIPRARRSTCTAPAAQDRHWHCGCRAHAPASSRRRHDTRLGASGSRSPGGVYSLLKWHRLLCSLCAVGTNVQSLCSQYSRSTIWLCSRRAVAAQSLRCTVAARSV